MDKISYKHFKCIMAYDITENQTCIEIEFSVDDSDEYELSWLGKMWDRETNKVIYWFGLTDDGLQAYEFDSFEAFINTKVFLGKSIKEVWDSITLHTIDGCNIQDRLPFYLSKA